jgi:RimJ/RimL family protein N-acetyltransferase
VIRDAVRADIEAMFGVSGDGVHVVAGPADRILVWRIDGFTGVAADPAELDRVQAAAAPDGADPFLAEWLRAVAEGWEVFGPSIHTYADASMFRPVSGSGVERVSVDALSSLRDAAALDEWGEGGVPLEDEDGTLLYGLRQDGAFVAAGNMTPWRGAPADVGLYTAPSHRGRGLGRAVASAMVAEQLPSIGIARYRALETNVASLAVARSLGFVPLSANYVARRPR